MKGKSISIPYSMVLKKYYCSKCGTRLKKEKTHRVVTEDDKDYYQYQDFNTFPRRDYDVYDYEFKCPSCRTRISFEEQRIIEKIQKKQHRLTLSHAEIRENYAAFRKANHRRSSIYNILVPILVNLIVFTLFYFFGTDRTANHLAMVAILFTLYTAYTFFWIVRKSKGKGKWKMNRSYSRDKELQLKKLHAYASHNRELIERSNQCYCFYCESSMKNTEIKEYLEKEETALCPKCGVDSIIPDSIDEIINASLLSEMHDYWF